MRQRVSGTFGVTAEVAARDKTIGDFESQAMNRAIAKNTPKWIRKIPYMYKPFWKTWEASFFAWFPHCVFQACGRTWMAPLANERK